jgi:hypothetical protein
MKFSYLVKIDVGAEFRVLFDLIHEFVEVFLAVVGGVSAVPLFHLFVPHVVVALMFHIQAIELPNAAILALTDLRVRLFNNNYVG